MTEVKSALPLDVQHLVKAQRRVRGTISDMTRGQCKITSPHGTFHFDLRSVKPNKNHPDRIPQVGDPCEFRLSHHIPPTAVSIRVAVPKVKASTESKEAHSSRPLDPNDAAVQACLKLSEELGSASTLAAREDNIFHYAVVVHTLVIRAMDAIEASSLASKQTLLRGLHDFLSGRETLPAELEYQAVNDLEKSLFHDFHQVCSVFNRLPEKYANAIRQTCKARGQGLANFVGREVHTLDDHTEYVSYVGGVPMQGLASIFSAHLGHPLDLSMASATGLLTQKTLSLRQFLEHSDTGRGAMWPRQVWGVQFDYLGQLAAPRGQKGALRSLNEMIADTLSHVAPAVGFVGALVSAPELCCYVAVPVVTAVTYLAQMCNNPKVFTRPASISTTTAAHINAMTHPGEVGSWLMKALNECQDRLAIDDASSYTAVLHIDRAQAAIQRLESAVAAISPHAVGENSLTRALLTRQGAVLGGRLLYSMLDSLNTVFQPDRQHYSYDPYGSQQLDQDNDDDEEEEKGALGYFTGIARGLLGFRKSAPSRPAIHVPPEPAQETFASFYDGGMASDHATSSDSSSKTSSPSSEDLPLPRSNSVPPTRNRSSPSSAAPRSRTPTL